MQSEIYNDFFKEFKEFFAKAKECKQKDSFNPLLAIRYIAKLASEVKN